MGYTMATAICNNCGARRHLSQRHRYYEPGTIVDLPGGCYATKECRGAKHTIASKNDKPPKRPMAKAKCNGCGHERRVGQQRKTYKIGDKIRVSCRNRDSEHRWLYMPHTVIANGGAA